MGYASPQDLFDNVPSVDLGFKLHLLYLSRDKDKLELKGDLYGMYIILNIMFKKVHFLLKKDDRLPRMMEIFKEVGVCFDPLNESSFKQDKIPVVYALLNELEVMIYDVCAENKIWLLKNRNEYDILKEIKILREDDVDDNSQA